MSKMFKYYYDFISQPSRALWIAFKMDKTPFEDCPVALRKREQTTKEFTQINRFGKVPCIVDDDFHLSESVAIIRYLAAKGQLSEALYPSDLKRRTQVDEFLEWYHLGLRNACTTYFRRLWLLPGKGLAHEPSVEKTAQLRKEMEDSLKVVEQIWLKDTKFLTGNELTVADLLGACEIEQTKLPKYNVNNNFPKIAEWISRVREQANPHYDKAHQIIYRASSS